MRALILASLLVLPSSALAGSWSFPGPIRVVTLHAELEAALGTNFVLESYDDGHVKITAADGFQATVEAIVAAHDPTRKFPFEIEAETIRAKVTAARADVKATTFPTPEDIDQRVDLLFPDPTYSTAQRAFFKRLAKLVLGLIRADNLD